MLPNIANLIYLKRSRISRIWLKHLGRQFGDNLEPKLQLIRKNRRKKGDLFSLLVRILNKETRLDADQLCLILRKVRMSIYSVSDLYTEISCLESAIFEYLIHNSKFSQAENFRQLAEDHCDCDLSALFEEWVY